jgi:adenylosuccinate synthase
MQKILADVVVDLQFGDCGKGKVTHQLAREGEYTHVFRFNGGSNAGHTIFHEGKKFVTHLIPAGVFHGITSVIGSGCVINVDKLLQEIEVLESNGIDVRSFLKIAKNAHLVLQSHIDEESQEDKIGTTRTGTGPAYRDKYARTGRLAELDCRLKDFLVDPYDVIFDGKQKKILLEGAQGFGLDIDWGDYPYVSSSGCTVSSAINIGIPAHSVKFVYGVAKPYVTYVGAKNFAGLHPALKQLQEVGQEFGATTGRPRQCNWLDIRQLVKATNINGVTHLIFNKLDILESVGTFIYIDHDGKLVELKHAIDFRWNVEDIIHEKCKSVRAITWSKSPDKI